MSDPISAPISAPTSAIPRQRQNVRITDDDSLRLNAGFPESPLRKFLRHRPMRILVCLVLGIAGASAGCGNSRTSSSNSSASPKAASGETNAAAPAETNAAAAELTNAKAAAPSPAPVGFGSITGRILWSGGEVPPPGLLIAKGDGRAMDAKICASTDLYKRDLIVDPKSKGVADVFVYLVRITGENPGLLQEVKARDAIIDQKNCEFLPFALAMHYQQKLVLKNSDPIRHITAVLAPNSTTISPSIVANGAVTYQLQHPERSPAPVRCPLHPWMDGWVLALDHPFFTISDREGRFTINGIPAGTQYITLRHPFAGFLNPERAKGREVTIKPGETLDIGAIPLALPTPKAGPTP